MLKKLILVGLLAGALLPTFSDKAPAAVADPSLGRVATGISGITNVRWVCGTYRCAWIPRYRGQVVVYPHMRAWVPPPSPHCIYRHNLFGWWLSCP
jgi:hypothetical protein